MNEEYNPMGWFEIPVTEVARAKKFYEEVLSLRLEEHQMGALQMAWFPMKKDGIGASGSLVKGDGYVPSAEGVLIYFSAPDLDAAASRARESGGKVITDRTSIGEYGFIAVIQDTEGNRIGLHSRE